MNFQTFHKYNRLVRRGQAEPLKCSVGHRLQLVLGDDGEPALEDFWCGSIVKPGEALYNRVEAKVEEYGL